MYFDLWIGILKTSGELFFFNLQLLNYVSSTGPLFRHLTRWIPSWLVKLLLVFMAYSDVTQFTLLLTILEAQIMC